MTYKRKTLTGALKNLRRKTTYLDGHWLFNGYKDKDGYGMTCWMDRPVSVHRFIAFVCLGLKLDSREQANHKPTCPYRNCWNPSCIYVGNQLDNMRNRFRRGPFDALSSDR